MSCLARTGFAVFLLLCASPLAGCSLTGDEHGQSVQSADTSVPLPANAIAFPLVARQKTDYTCGDVATLGILRYWRFADYRDVPEDALYAPLHTTPANGTDPQPIADYLNGIAGVTAQYRTNVSEVELEQAVDRGEPPIVDLQAWRAPPYDYASDWTDGHYAVLIAYDEANLYFMDPSLSEHYVYLPRAELQSRWHDIVDASRLSQMAIFVRATGTPHRADLVPPRATRME